MRTTPTGAPPALPDITLEWPRVRIEHVELVRATADQPHACVRAGLHLGRLLPVDVAVTVTAEGAAPGDALTAPMWSAQSYHNGGYVFEAHVPDARVAAARHVAVHVRPHAARHVARALVAIVPAAELEPAPGPEPAPPPPPARSERPGSRVSDQLPTLASTGDDLGP